MRWPALLGRTSCLPMMPSARKPLIPEPSVRCVMQLKRCDARAFALRACMLVLPAWIAGCGGAKAPDSQHAQLQIIASPATARVYVQETYVGTAQALNVAPLKLSPGVHLLTLKRDGWFPHDVKVRLPAGHSVLRVTLRRVPPSFLHPSGG